MSGIVGGKLRLKGVDKKKKKKKKKREAAGGADAAAEEIQITKLVGEGQLLTSGAKLLSAQPLTEIQEGPGGWCAARVPEGAGVGKGAGRALRQAGSPSEVKVDWARPHHALSTALSSSGCACSPCSLDRAHGRDVGDGEGDEVSRRGEGRRRDYNPERINAGEQRKGCPNLPTPRAPCASVFDGLGFWFLNAHARRCCPTLHHGPLR